VWTYRPKHHKGAWRGKSRAVAIGPRCQALLAEYPTGDPAAPVFVSRRGSAYTVSGYRQAIEAACSRAGIPVWTPHQLRHAAATEVRQRFGLDAARATLGHSTTDTTEIYAARDASIASQVASQIG